MIAVIFEVSAAPGRKSDYLALAAALKTELIEMEGFISIERFESLSEPGKLLSLSFWEDETAVERWRNLASHRDAQRQGRQGVFSDYRLRVASVVRDYGMQRRSQAPEDSRNVHERSPLTIAAPSG